jgi:glycosyltransferase involved in cell wall biosynthesis
LEEHLLLAEQVLALYKLDADVCQSMQAELRQRWQANNIEPLPQDLQARITALQPADPGGNERPITILIVVYSLITGGGEILPIRLANTLKRLGYGVTVLNCRQHPDQPGVRRMLRCDIPLLELNSLDQLSAIIEEFGIDVVHSHHPWVDSMISEILRSGCDVCHVITSHGMYDEFDNAEISRMGSLLRPWVKHATYVAEHNLDALLRLGFQQEQATKIPNAIDLQDIEPIDRSSLGISEQAFVVCLASRGIREKGWQEAIEAVRLVQMQSGQDVHLLILGDGAELERLQPSHHEPDIHFLGFQENVSRYFACADLGILPSFYPGESQPLTLIECLAAGRPYLASDVGEIRAMLETPEGLAGQVIALNDGRVSPHDLAAALLRYLQDPDLLERHTLLASLAARKFDPIAMANAYVQVYRRALTTNASPTC